MLKATFKPLPTPTLKKMGIQGVRDEMLKELVQIGKDTQKELLKAFYSWDHQPQVKQRVHMSQNDPEMGVEVYTEDEVAHWLDEGTEAHLIIPIHAKALRFQTQYARKSRVGSLQSFPGGSSGPYAGSKGHMVSGIRPRKFSYTLERWLFREMQRRLQAAAERGAKQASQ